MRRALALLAVLCGCDGETTSTPGGAGGGPDAGPEGGCGTDPNEDSTTADALVPGAPVEEYVCTPRDSDWYAFDVPADRPLLRWLLENDAPLTPVIYEVSIHREREDGVGHVAGPIVDPGRGRARVSFGGLLRLEEPGVHYLTVKDDTGLRVDRGAPYRLSIELLSDPDTHEPNPDRDQAPPIDGCTQGYLSHDADEDWFVVQVPEDKLLSVDVQTASEVIEPRYDLTPADSEQPIVGGHDATLHALSAGAYYLRVVDPEGRVDLSVPYEVCASLVDDPDPGEHPRRNDRPRADLVELREPDDEHPDATNTVQGLIRVWGDRDWFVVRAHPATSAETPTLFQVDLAQDAPSARGLRAAFSLVRPHAETGCDEDADCSSLSQECNAGHQCPGFVCNRAIGRCAGAGVCLDTGRCGVTVFSAAIPVDGTALRTRQPMFEPGTYYLVVHDFQDDDWDPEVAYTLTWQVLTERDDNEPNGVLAPYPGSYPETYAPGARQAKPLAVDVRRDPETGAVVEVTTECAEGYISYPRDEDWFFVRLPVEIDSPYGTWGIEVDYTDGGSDLKLHYQVFVGGLDRLLLHTNWYEGGESPDVPGPIPESGIWGGSECVYACWTTRRPFRLRVIEAGDQRGFDDVRSYRACFRFTPGCPEALCPCGLQCPRRPDLGGEGEGEGEGGAPEPPE